MGSSPWIKAFEAVLVASRFAGPCCRLHPPVDLARAPAFGPADRERRPLMAPVLRRLFRLPMPPVLALGPRSRSGAGSGKGGRHARLRLLAAVIGCHPVCRRLLHDFDGAGAWRGHRWSGVLAERSALPLAASVVLLVVKPS